MTTTFDAIIVGSGAGGCAAAYALVRAGLSVALLEKGRELPRDASTLDVDAVVRQGRFLSREIWLDRRGARFAPEEHFNIGGKTKWYGAALLRYSPSEFTANEAHQCRGWPISFEDMAPFYSEAEQLLGVRNFEGESDLMRIAQRLRRHAPAWRNEPMPLGLSAKILDNPREAGHFDGFASVAGLKSEGESSFLSHVRSSPRLQVYEDTEVTDLLPDSGRPLRIAGVRLADGRTLCGRSVLLAAGALHSPRLLQRFVDANRLPDSLSSFGEIGRNLKMHLLTAVVAVSASVKKDLIRKTRLFLHEEFPHSSIQPLGFDGELIANLIPRWVPRFAARPIGRRAYGFFLQTEDGSHRDNRVIAAAVGHPTLDYDAARLEPASTEHHRLIRRFRLDLLGAGLLAFAQRIGPAGTAHVNGTLIAGDDPSTSVVDAHGKVHGLESLYVVDGSVLPRSSRVNPSLTIFAWSLRTASMLAKSLASGAALLAAFIAVSCMPCMQAQAAPAAQALESVAMTVSNADLSREFYEKVLNFERVSDTEVGGDGYEHLYGIFGMRMRRVTLKLGDELLELDEYLSARGRPIPPDSASNDHSFQHVAIIVADMDRAFMQLREHHVTFASSGPQRLPAWNKEAGGIAAFYFRDPDGHYLEILHFPPGKGDARWQRHGGLFLGIDHTAIVVADTESSLRFYRDVLGLRIAGTSENYGTEQEHLNNVFGARLRITALRAAHGPGVELLEYLAPRNGRAMPWDTRANDLWHWQIHWASDVAAVEQAVRAGHFAMISPGPVSIESTAGGPGRILSLTVTDPDGHANLLEQPAND